MPKSVLCNVTSTDSHATARSPDQMQRRAELCPCPEPALCLSSRVHCPVGRRRPALCCRSLSGPRCRAPRAWCCKWDDGCCDVFSHPPPPPGKTWEDYSTGLDRPLGSPRHNRCNAVDATEKRQFLDASPSSCVFASILQRHITYACQANIFASTHARLFLPPSSMCVRYRAMRLRKCTCSPHAGTLPRRE
jgi:hypothetical protein